MNVYVNLAAEINTKNSQINLKSIKRKKYLDSCLQFKQVMNTNQILDNKKLMENINFNCRVRIF
jgi:hypothetical protein